jgi:hypothetical protein
MLPAFVVATNRGDFMFHDAKSHRMQYFLSLALMAAATV